MSTHPTSNLRLHAAALGALALITGLGYLMGVRPLLAARVEAWELDRTVGETQTTVNDLRSEFMATKGELAAARQTLDSNNLSLVGSSLLNSQLAKLGIAAEEAGVVLTETAPGQPEQGSLLIRTPIKLSGRGHYPDLARFLRELNSALKDTVVVGFSLSGRADAPTEPATFSVDLLWYALRESADSGAHDAAVASKAGSGG